MADYINSILIAFVLVLLIILIVIIVRKIIIKFDNFTVNNAENLKSSIDGLKYRVHLTHNNPKQAANLLAKLNKRGIDFMRFLKKKYIKDENAKMIYPGRYETVKQILRRYNPDTLVENSPLDPEGDTSYTIDKGQKLALCIRDKKGNHDFHDIDTLTFVFLHELTHIGIKEMNHPLPFWRAFKFLLEDSKEAKIYMPKNYANEKVSYCGVEINYNPLFDENLSSLK